jgi:hypothetical protein
VVRLGCLVTIIIVLGDSTRKGGKGVAPSIGHGRPHALWVVLGRIQQVPIVLKPLTGRVKESGDHELKPVFEGHILNIAQAIFLKEWAHCFRNRTEGCVLVLEVGVCAVFGNSGHLGLEFEKCRNDFVDGF